MAKFFDLPPELRDEIYSLVLVQQDPIILTSFTYLKDKRAIQITSKPEPTLSAVNRQIRVESLRAYYGFNAFEFWSFDDAIQCLAYLGPERIRFLKNVRIFSEGFSSRRVQLQDLFHRLNSTHKGVCALTKSALSVQLWDSFFKREWKKVVAIEEFEVAGLDYDWFVRYKEKFKEYEPTLWKIQGGNRYAERRMIQS